ncbi:hypothetical protein QYF36_022510 [Acer negundo]|nr:hypothetical protein QYF36_022510 [Acer negundo]
MILERLGFFLRSVTFAGKGCVFMYGSLHAFFTPECRAKQIAVDKVVAKQPRGTGNECKGRNGVKDQSGMQDRCF